MGQDIHISSDGTLTVGGKTITPQEVSAAIPEITKTAEQTVQYFRTKMTWTSRVRYLEKFACWAAALVAGTNGFAQFHLANNLRSALVGSAALVLAAIHNHTPDI